jgi:hypothetical protein
MSKSEITRVEQSTRIFTTCEELSKETALVLVAEPSPDCLGCYFMGSDCYQLAAIYNCRTNQRADGQSVIWRKLDAQIR